VYIISKLRIYTKTKPKINLVRLKIASSCIYIINDTFTLQIS